MRIRTLSAAIVGAAATMSIVMAGPAVAGETLKLDLGSSVIEVPLPDPSAPNQPGNSVGSNGVASMTMSVSKRFGTQFGPQLYNTKFVPWVKWSARDRSNAEVKGKNCQIEIQFPNTSQATYKSAGCQGEVGFSKGYHTTPGRYSIVVVDRVSGKSASQAFTIE